MMKTILTIVISMGLYLAQAQSSQDACVEISVVVNDTPPSIALSWLPSGDATQYLVYRKSPASISWGSAMATLAAAVSSYTDTTVNAGQTYEYRVYKKTGTYNAYGYSVSGVDIPLKNKRGKIILGIETSVADSLATEIQTLISDFEGDSWIVDTFHVLSSATPVETKNKIKQLYNVAPSNTKALCLLGHVPVPYSGALNPDGHPDHLGAWPADVYYGDINGVWTDASINITTANDERHHNVPGDGKFDQSDLPSDVDLEVGRIDFAKMPSFPASEITLLRNYLNKDHAYRHGEIRAAYRAVVDDNFGYFGGEAFAASGYRSFSPLVGKENVMANDYFTTLADSTSQWSYGCGGGWYQGAGGVGSTGDFVNSNLRTVFTLLFGSYFGDWDSQDNFLRAPLAQGWTLTNAWSGRPHWLLHPMGLGETIGYCARLSQNNNSTYTTGYGARFVHIALMGDPTLRNNVVLPPKNVDAQAYDTGAMITWSPSADDVMGYNVYRRLEGEREYTILNDELVSSASFQDPCQLQALVATYLIKAVKLEVTPSGSYYNASQGMSDTVVFTSSQFVQALAAWNLTDNHAAFTDQSLNATSWHWDFGDGETSDEQNPTHTYGNGTFMVTLFASSACDVDTFTFELSVLTATIDPWPQDIQLSPNPAHSSFELYSNGTEVGLTSLEVISSTGISVLRRENLTLPFRQDLTAWPMGIYMVRIVRDHSASVRLLVIQ